MRSLLHFVPLHDSESRAYQKKLSIFHRKTFLRACTHSHAFASHRTDNGMCVDYAIAFEDGKWSFVGQEFSRMDYLLDFMHGEPLTSKTGGYDVLLTTPAPGGASPVVLCGLFIQLCSDWNFSFE